MTGSCEACGGPAELRFCSPKCNVAALKAEEAARRDKLLAEKKADRRRQKGDEDLAALQDGLRAATKK